PGEAVPADRAVVRGPDQAQLAGQHLAGEVGDLGLRDDLGDGDVDGVPAQDEIVEGVGGAAHGAEAVDPERLVRERRVDDLEPGADAGGVREASCHGRNSTRAGYA